MYISYKYFIRSFDYYERHCRKQIVRMELINEYLKYNELY